MKFSTCTDRPILVPCSLPGFAYQIDPYIGCEHLCHYCYVLDQAETDWAREILQHRDIAGRLREELAEIPPQTIYLGYHTDPYQPCEAELGQTRAVLELLHELGFSASLLTKSDLVLRDLDLLSAMPEANVSVSVAFLDDDVRQVLEAATMPTERRIDALQQLKAAGVSTSALVCPVIPYLTETKRLVEAVAPHTDRVWIYGLNVPEPDHRGWRNVQSILGTHFPTQQAAIEAVIQDRDHAYWSELKDELETLATGRDLNLSIHV